jgi:outer membrane protein
MNRRLAPIACHLIAWMSDEARFVGLVLIAALAGCVVSAPTVNAETELSPDHFYLHFGPGALVFDAGATVKSSGVVIPGATVHIDPNVTLITELGYRWSRVGVSLTGGYPPLATVNGAGSLSSLGSLGRIRYGPTVLSLQYHLPNIGRLDPYIGAGPVFLLIFKNEDDAVRHLNVRDSTGAAVQLGAEFRLAPAWSLVIDVKKASLKTTATAVLDGAPISANIRLDPTVITGGFSYRF